jgi:hypothetical protein
VFGGRVIAAADLNGDTRPDLVVGVHGGFEVLLNKGDGTFLAPVFYGTNSGDGALAIALIDLNRDGHIDIVALSDHTDCMDTFLNNGDGAFLPSVCVPLPGMFRGKSMVVGDFNGDGQLDIAISYVDNGLNPNDVVLFNQGDGSFSAPAAFDAPGGPGDCCGDADFIAAADLNGDGLADIIAYTGALAVLINQGNGKFASPVIYSNGSYGSSTGLASGYSLADIDGDGLPDVLTNDHYYAFDYGINPGNGTLPLSLVGIDSFGYQHNSPIAVADFDNNGTEDVVVLSSQLLAFANDGKANFTLQNTQTPPYSYDGASITVGDFDGDGLLDIAVWRVNQQGTVTVDVLHNSTPVSMMAPVAVSEVFPPQGGNAGTVSSVEIAGTGFPPDAQITLTGPGPDITPTDVTVAATGTLITVNFDLRGAVAGSYTLVVKDKNGNVLLVKPGAFTVVQGGASNVWIDIVGFRNLRTGQPQAYFLQVGNSGTVDSPTGKTVTMLLPSYITYSAPQGQIAGSMFQIGDSNIVLFQLASSIRAGGTLVIPINLAAPDDPNYAHQPFEIQVW